MTKKCKTCNELKPITEFNKSYINKKGQQYKPKCKVCLSNYQKQWIDNNKEQVDAYSKQYRKENKQKTRDVAIQYYYNNKSERLKYMTKWKIQNKEKWLSYQREYDKTNRQCKREQIKAKATEVQGVYALYDNGECLYVGESSWLNHRLYLHKSYTRKPDRNKTHRKLYEILHEKHPNFICGIVEETPNHKEREKFYINQLKPKYNGYGV